MRMNGPSTQSDGVLRERFYRSVAETLALLHATPDRDRCQAVAAVTGILASTMDLPLVWAGRREPGQTRLLVLAASGPAAAYAATLELSADAGEPGGRGPVGIVLREEHARAVAVDAPEFAPWQDAARGHGLGAVIVAAARTRDGGQLALAAYVSEQAAAWGEEILDWAQRLADELSRFWDHQQLLERSLRLGRYRSAQRAIQRALLEQPDPAAVYRTLAQALVEIAGAVAVDVLVAVDGEPMLQRVALVGSIVEVVRCLPMPPRLGDGGYLPAPTLALMQGTPVIRRHPQIMSAKHTAFHELLRDHAGAVGCWPLYGTLADETGAHAPSGVMAVFTPEADAFEDDLCRLLDEIAEATSLALRQHAQRYALQLEKDRQTYLALHDALTGLPNRRALERHLEQALARADLSGRLVAVGLLDLDDLKPINDHHGHAAGDLLLVEVASRFHRMLRADDYVARLGGDEFVLVFEALQGEAEIEPLLLRIDEALREPLQVDDSRLTVGASLGVAMYARGCQATGEQLLRRADQAMYRVKAQKRHRTRWWSLVAADGSIDRFGETVVVRPYGNVAAALLEACAPIWAPRLTGIVAKLFEQLRAHDGIVWMLELLPEVELLRLEGYLHKHLQVLMQPSLALDWHRGRAIRSGEFYAACGLEEVWLLEAIEQLRDTLALALGGTGQVGRQGLAVLLQRLGMERQWQLESIRALQHRRVAVLGRINALAWSAESYLALIQGVADILVTHKEIAACSVGRPDEAGRLTYEAVAGDAFTRYLRALAQGQAAEIRVNADQAEGGGPSGRAWRSGSIQRCAHYASDPAMAGWRAIVDELGVVSSASIPLCPAPRQPAVVLAVYSPYLGGFRSEDQQAFLDQIKTVLDLALARLAPPRPGTELLPFIARERWRAMVATPALEMHYQPLVRLADGQPAEIEALARLRDIDGTLLAPTRFLPALGADELLGLFRQGLGQALACCAAQQAAGHALDVSINVPASAMEDARYVRAVTDALAAQACAPQCLLLEVLESPAGTEHAALPPDTGVATLRAAGVRLVEDDLGAGYSSLIRLRQWPFDRIKIDQAIVRQAHSDPLGTLRFVRQLIRIGHDLALEVVVEGLESTDLIEAAGILGADFGQGYALARPMPAAALPAWLAGYRAAPANGVPRTGLGALAGELRWEEQFLALPAEPAIWARHAQTICDPGRYLHAMPAGSRLHGTHEAMHRAAMAGPLDPGYRQARSDFLACLIGHVLDQAANASA